MRDPYQLISQYADQKRKAEALQIIKEKDFSKEQLEMMISITLHEGGVLLPEIQRMVDDWENILRVYDGPGKSEKYRQLEL
jgi:hypothetical protein